MIALLALRTALAQAPALPPDSPPPAAGPVPDVTHAGIPIADVQALHAHAVDPGSDAGPDATATAVRLEAPQFGTSTSGWSLIVPEGIVFVHVAPTIAAAVAWTELQLTRQRTPPLAVEQPVAGVEAAWRRDTDFAMLRDGNIGIMVQGTPEATEEAALVRSLIRTQGPPWPAPLAPVQQPDGTWLVEDPDAAHLAWQGGRRIPGAGLRFSSPPDRVVRWDSWGRAAVWSADDGAEPPASPAPVAP